MASCGSGMLFFKCSLGSRNDINVLKTFSTVGRILAGAFILSLSYVVNSVERTLPHYLADGIYPNWASFVKNIKEGTRKKERKFVAAQEVVRKDGERDFGVLTARFQIIQSPAHLWYREDIESILKECIIMHKMKVEARRDGYGRGMATMQLAGDAREMLNNGNAFSWNSLEVTQKRHGGYIVSEMWAAMVSERKTRITSTKDNRSLHHDLIEHIWKRHGQ